MKTKIKVGSEEKDINGKIGIFGKIFAVLAIFLIIFAFTVSGGEKQSSSSETPNKKGTQYNETETKSVIIKFKDNVTDFKLTKGKLKHKFKLLNAISAELSPEYIEELENETDIESIELDVIVSSMVYESIQMLNIPKVHNFGYNGSGVRVAVLDTGIVRDETLFNIGFEYDFVENDNYSQDEHGHGTHVSGIVVASAPGVEIMPVRVLNASGKGYASEVIAGIEWAIENNADVISLSLGAPGSDGSSALSQAADYAVNSGVVVVAGAGNDPSNIASPGDAHEVITVGAIDKSYNIASFSGRGPTTDGREKPDLVAPGVNIYSYSLNGMKTMSGTSQAVAFVSGISALLLQNNKTAYEIKNILKASAVDLGYDVNMQGEGMVDAAKAFSIDPETGAAFSNGTNGILTITFITNESETEPTKPIKIKMIKLINGTEVKYWKSTVTTSKNLSFSLEPGTYKIYTQIGGQKSITEYNNGGNGYIIIPNDTVVVPLYSNTQNSDVFADAPWRVEPGEYVPILLEIKDADQIDYDVYEIRIYDNSNNNLIHIVDLEGDCCLLGAVCGFENIHDAMWYRIAYVDPSDFTQDSNKDIQIRVEFVGATVCDPKDGTERSYLTVHIGADNLPKFNGWYCGDTHYHSSYTDNNCESGGPIESTVDAGSAMGLDWVTVTNHSFDLQDINKWNNLVSECNTYSNTNFKCLVGEEISCEWDELGSWDRYSHFLGYSVSTPIFGDEREDSDCEPNVDCDTYNCEEINSIVEQNGGFGYVAHPVSGAGDLFRVPWQDYSLTFTGLEIWNGVLSSSEEAERLQQGLDEWISLLLSDRKVFIEGGSDAHGDFNPPPRALFSCDIAEFPNLDPENAFGKVRTYCYMPSGLTDSNILNALRHGNCFMTDGPALKFEINGVGMGNNTVTLNNTSTGTLTFEWKSTSEFGYLKNITIKRGDIGASEEVEVEISYPYSYAGTESLTINPTPNCYYRLEGFTSEGKRVYTNPVWVKIAGCTCNSCDGCTDKLNNDSCKYVILNESIMNHLGTCIDNPANFTNKIFDCLGHTIDGSGSGSGVYLTGKSSIKESGLWESWNRIVDVLGYEDAGLGVAVDSKDNVVVTGYTVDASFRDDGKAEYLTMKYDPDGNILWNKTAGSSFYDSIAQGVVVDSNDNIIVGGFDCSEGKYSCKYMLRKYDSYGNLIWTKGTIRNSNDHCHGVALDSNENIILTGYTFNYGQADFWVIKYDSNGDVIWSKATGGSNTDDIGERVAVDSNNNIIVTGITGNAGAYDYLTVKYSPNGNVMWSKTAAGVGANDYGWGVAIDSNDNIIVTGSTMMIKYDPNGNVMWSKLIDYQGQGVAVDIKNNIIVGGWKGVDTAVIKYDPNGNVIWNITSNISGEYQAFDVALDSMDNIITSGRHIRPYGSAPNEWNVLTIKYAKTETHDTIKNCNIKGFEKGIYMLNSSFNNISNNKLSNNNIGVYSQNSNSTAINSNIVCGNAILDFNSSDWLSSYGNSNICDNPDGWNDTGITGCTYSCYNPFFIKRFSAQYNSHNSLLTITVTFKTNSGNYGGNDALVDLKLTDSSNNVIKTWKNVATARGKVNFKENIIALPIGTYAVTVTDVNLLGYTFDDTGNSDSFTVK